MSSTAVSTNATRASKYALAEKLKKLKKALFMATHRMEFTGFIFHSYEAIPPFSVDYHRTLMYRAEDRAVAAAIVVENLECKILNLERLLE